MTRYEESVNLVSVAWKHIVLCIILLVGMSGCRCYYSYRQNEDIAGTTMGYYECIVEVSRGQEQLTVGVHPIKQRNITHLDSSIKLDLFFHQEKRLLPTGYNRDVGVYNREYSLKDMPISKTDAPLHLSISYQVDSGGVRLTKAYHAVLKKHCTRGNFSVH